MKNTIRWSLGLLMLFSTNCLWAQAGGWRELTPSNPPPAREGATLVTLTSGDLLLFGGNDGSTLFNDLHLFSNSSNNWTAITPTNTPPSARTNHSAILENNGKMRIFGGKDGTGNLLNDVWSYDPTANSWGEINVTGPQPTPREGQSMVTTSDGSSLIFGGTDVNGQPLMDNWRFNSDHTYTQQSDGLRPQTHHAAALIPSPDPINNTIVDGIFTFGVPNIVDVFNVVQNTWAELSSGVPTSGFQASAVSSNQQGEEIVFLFGGHMNNSDSNGVWEYNADTLTTTQRSENLPIPLSNAAAAIPGVPVFSKQTAATNVVVFGGVSGGVASNRTFQFFPNMAPPPAFQIDASVEGSWLDPNTPGQGMLMDYFPGVNKLFVAWFTFDPAGGPKLANTSVRWATAVLDITGNTASGVVFSTTDGAFNAPMPAPTNTEIGTMSIQFSGCDTATMDFTLDPPDNVMGTISIVPLGTVVDTNFTCGGM